MKEFDGRVPPPPRFEHEEHHEQGERGHGRPGRGGRGKRGPGFNKMAMKHRNVEHLHTRAAFVSFLMWMCVLIAGAIGFRASKTQENSPWIRCTFKKSLIFIVLASLLGIWKLTLDAKLMKGMERFHKEWRNKPKGNMFGKHKKQWNFKKQQAMSKEELIAAKKNWISEKQEQFFGRGRGLQATPSGRQGRRLGSAFGVFDFVNNAISSGVKQAKHSAESALKKYDEGLSKAVQKGVQKVHEGIENIAKESLKDIKTMHEPSIKAEEPVQSPVDEPAVAEEPQVEAAFVEGAAHPELKASIENPAKEVETSPIEAPAVQDIKVTETPAAEQVEQEEEVAVEEKEPELDAFELEELAAMQSLADMGRLFNDEDEARMVKLTEDLDAWINKYATTFEDPEEILFEVSSSLMTDEMEA